MFLGREKELSELERLYEAGGFQMIIIYGRRRVGKTTLINHFTQNKRAVYFTAVESDSRRNLELFSRAAMRERGISAELSFADWNKAFDYVAARAGNDVFVLVIDEYHRRKKQAKDNLPPCRHYVYVLVPLCAGK